MSSSPRVRSGFLVVLTAVLTALASGPPAGAQAPALKVGLLLPQTGPLSFEGNSAIRGFELFVAQQGGKLGGLPVEILKEDTQARPDVGLTKARQLVEQAKVDLLVGPVNSAVALAIRDYVHRQKIPLVVPVAAAEQLTRGQNVSPYIFRVQVAPSQANLPFGGLAYDQLGYRKMVLIGADFVAGREGVEFFKRGFTAKGGQVVGEIFAPLGTADYAPFLGRIRPAEADAAYAWVAGADAVRLVKQWQETGLKGKLPLLGFAGITEDVILPEVKDAALGHVAVTPYTPAIDNEANRAFVQAYRARYGGENPALPAAGAFLAGQVLDAALRASGGLAAKDRFIAAIEGLALDTPRGRISFDKNHQVVCDVYVVRAEKVGDRVENRIVTVLKQVRQAP